MNPRSVRHLAALAATSMILTLASCGSDAKSSSDTKAPASTESQVTTPVATEPAETDPPVTEPTETDPPVTEPAETDPPVTEPAETDPPVTDPAPPETFAADDVEAALKSLMLTPADLDTSFVEEPSDESSSPTPCGVDIDAVNPYRAIARTTLVSESFQLLVTEAIRVYDSADEAVAAAQIAAEALSCGGDESVTLGEITDVSDDVGTDAFALTATNVDTEGVIIVAVVTDSVVTMQFAGALGASEAAGAPNPVDVAAFAVQRILDFLNSDA